MSALGRGPFAGSLLGFERCAVLTDGPPPHDFVYLEVNAAFEALTGLRDVVGRRVSEVIPGFREHDAAWLNAYSEVATTGVPARFVRRVESLGLWLSVAVHSPERGQFVAVFDATTERPIAAELGESEERMRSIVTTMAEGVVLQSASGAILGCNAAAERILGLSKDQIEGRTSFDPAWRAIREDGRPFPGDEHPSMVTLRTGAAITDALMGVHKPDGTLTWISISSEPLRHAGAEAPYAVVTTFTDVTERMRTAAELAEATARLEVALDAAEDGVWEWHVPSERVGFGERWASRLGLELAEREPTLATWRSAVHPDDLEAAAAHAKAALRGDLPAYDDEYRVRRKDGAWVWLHLRGKVIERDANGEPIRAAGTCSDITARKRVEEQLRDREAWLAAIYAGTPLGIVRTDVGGIVLDANPAFLGMVGYELAELVGRPVHRLSADEAEDARLRGALLAGGGGRAAGETSWRRKDGAILRVMVRVSVVLDGAGRPFHFGVVEDVTERRRLSDALERERRRYRSLLEISQDGLHLLDEHGTLVEASASFLRMLGHGPDAVGRLRLSEWDPAVAPHEMEPRVRASMDEGGLFRARHRRADGTSLDVEVHAGAVELDGRPFLLASARDITARVEAERALEQKQAELEAVNESLAERVAEAVAELRAKDQLLITHSREAAMGEMIGHIAHQWRQPLNALGLVLSDLRDAARFGELDGAAVVAAVGVGERLVQKMSSTINDFRDFLRPGREKSEFSAHESIAETVAIVGATFRSAGIELTVEAAPDVRLFGHPNEYAQVLLNLLTNARQSIQACARGGRVRVRLAPRDGFGCLTVTDDGGGIPEAILGRIFEPYFSTKERGTGIGLFMSREIVEKSLGGRITARNLEWGAELTVLVPLARGEGTTPR